MPRPSFPKAERERAETANAYASAFFNLTQEGGISAADKDVLMMILARLRHVLRDGCPACAEVELAKEVEDGKA